VTILFKEEIIAKLIDEKTSKNLEFANSKSILLFSAGYFRDSLVKFSSAAQFALISLSSCSLFSV